jgi:hypothetical protein
MPILGMVVRLAIEPGKGWVVISHVLTLSYHRAVFSLPEGSGLWGDASP